MAVANMYRVGDFVYFEESSDGPYNIRRIEELNKTNVGIEARVVLYHRRRDISPALLKIADQAQRRFDEYYEVEKKKPEKFSEAAGHTIANGSDVKKEDDPEEPIDVKETEEDKKKVDWGFGGLPIGSDSLSEESRYRMRQHELFLSRQVEIMPATMIRGKCRVTLLSEVETVDNYTNDDLFFYSLVYDPTQMTLLADKGAIRVGRKYQAEVDELMIAEKQALENENEKEQTTTPGVDGAATSSEPTTTEAAEPSENGAKMEVDDSGDENENGNGALMIDEDDELKVEAAKDEEEAPKVEVEVLDKDRDVLVYHPYHSLTDRDIDQFLIIARAVGTFSRALDTTSSAKLPSLHMTAAYASRDITLFHAMALLHQANYELGQAVKYLVPPAIINSYPLEADKATGHQTQHLGGPILCRDQMEEWSAPEANLFEEALEKYGKDFSDIRNDYLPWKAIRDIVEYYYMYKASNRYSDHKKKKQSESESKLKQVYIPSYTKPSSNIIGAHNTTSSLVKSATPCENCKISESVNWYLWGPPTAQLRLCQNCWICWKKFGGLSARHCHDLYDKNPALLNSTNGLAERPRQPQMVVSQMKATATPIPQQIIAQLPASHPLMQAARAVANNKNNLNLANFNLANLGARLPVASATAAGVAASPSTATPVSTKQQASGKPSVMYYTTIWRRAIKRLLPREVFNVRKVSRRPFTNIDLEVVAKCTLGMEKNNLFKTALPLSKNSPKFNEAMFVQGIIKMQTNYLKGLAALKRPATAGTFAGEPSAKQPFKRAATAIGKPADKNLAQVQEEKGVIDESVGENFKRLKNDFDKAAMSLALMLETQSSCASETLMRKLLLIPPSYARKNETTSPSLEHIGWLQMVDDVPQLAHEMVVREHLWSFARKTMPPTVLGAEDVVQAKDGDDNDVIIDASSKERTWDSSRFTGTAKEMFDFSRNPQGEIPVVDLTSDVDDLPEPMDTQYSANQDVNQNPQAIVFDPNSNQYVFVDYSTAHPNYNATNTNQSHFDGGQMHSLNSPSMGYNDQIRGHGPTFLPQSSPSTSFNGDQRVFFVNQRPSFNVTGNFEDAEGQQHVNEQIQSYRDQDDFDPLG